jgi:ribosomal 50S subunit-recycling heat shock protein
MCTKDYRYWLDHTPPEERGLPPRLARDFWDFVTKRHAQGCWTWTGPRNHQGYGFWGKILAHRHSWALTNGPIPEGMWILHHCDNKPCVNPAHLYAGTRVENTQDAVDRGRIHSPKQDRCPAGHLKAGDNLIVVRTRQYLAYRCRICERARKRESERRRYWRKKEAAQ